MIKKFVKKIGKGIKKIGKAIGKPFKKLMKNKIGKIIGTIGMMLIGGWMIGGAKAFVGGMFQGQTMGTAFSNALGQMGQQAASAYKSVTDAITGMFGADPTSSAKNLAEATSGGSTTITTGTTGTTATDIAQKTAETTQATTGVSATDVTGQAKATTTDGSLVTTGTETASGKIVGDDLVSQRIGVIEQKPQSSLLDPKTLEVDFATDLSTSNITPDLAINTELPTLETGGPKFLDRFPRVAELVDKSKNISELYDNTLGIAPLQDTNLPKFIRNTTIGEGITVASLLQSPEEPYVSGRSDVSGALEALDENTTRLYSQMPMDQFMSQTSLPSPTVIGTSDILGRYKAANYIYDTTLLS